MRTCIYCNKSKRDSEFSYEHIWPDALGGDHLPNFWKAKDVCATCNNTSGLYVDGEFLKTWLGRAERSHGWENYLSISYPDRALPPLTYMGHLNEVSEQNDVEFWIGPCGAHILHFRPTETRAPFHMYAGGNPLNSKKPKRAGRAYLTLTTLNNFWIRVTFSAFKAHFPKVERYATNCNFLDNDVGIQYLNWEEPPHPPDISTLHEVMQASKKGQRVKTQARIQTDFDSRFLAKLALGVGYNIFGNQYIKSNYAGKLRKAMWEADSQKRHRIEIQGTRYANRIGLGGAERLLKWPSGWVLLLKVVDNKLTLTIVCPTGNVMSIVVAESMDEWPEIKKEYGEGWIWLVVPPLGRATEAISLPNYIAHQIRVENVQALRKIEDSRISPEDLPFC